MKKYELDIVNFYDDSEDVVAYGSKGHHDFELIKQTVINGEYDEYNGILQELESVGIVVHTWYKRIPTSDISVEVKQGVRGATPYTVWCMT